MLFRRLIRNRIGDTERPAHLKVVAAMLAAIFLAGSLVGIMNFLCLSEGPPPGNKALQVILTPILPVTNSSLKAIVASSNSETTYDTIDCSYQWYRNAVLQPALTDDTVDASYVSRGDTWKCAVTPTSGPDAGTTAAAEVTIQNGPPTAPKVAVLAEGPMDQRNLICHVTIPSSDPENDPITYSYQWDKKGAAQPGLTTNIVNYSYTTASEMWKCEVTASDGAGGAVSTSNEVTVVKGEIVSSSSTHEVAAPSEVNALYVWSDNYKIVHDTAERDRFFSTCAQNKINTVWMAIDADSLKWFNDTAGYPVEVYTSFIQQANDRGIAIHAMLSSAGGTVLENRAAHKEYILAILRYNKEHPEARFAGVHFDIENVATGWSVSRFLDSFTSYIRDLKTWAYDGQTVKSQGLVLSLYNDQVPEAGGSSLQQWLNYVGEFDLVEIQAYSDSAAQIIANEEANHRPGRAALLDQEGIPFIIVSETDNLGSSRDRITFWEEGLAYYYKVRTELDDHYKQFSTFRGFALHHYGSLLEIKD